MDTDGNGSISISEYVEYLRGTELVWVSDNRIFKEFDKDGNGALDFDEFITFFYMLATDRFIFCGGCGRLLKEIYFTCFQCFRQTSSYDLCCPCFHLQNFTHHRDAIFYDNYALLRSGNLVPRGTIAPSPSKSQGKSKKLLVGLEALVKGPEVGEIIVSSGCNIM